MIKIVRDIELRHLRELADEYRSRGYATTIMPGSSELPRFLRGADAAVDLLARNKGETVVVQIKRADHLAKADDIVRLAELLEDRRGWRFELAVIPGTGKDPAIDSLRTTRSTPLRVADIRARLAEARSLLGAGHDEAAHLLAWATLEALMRQALARSGVDLDDAPLVKLIKSGYAYGLIPKAAYETLSNALKQRAAVAHGFRLAARKQLSTRPLLRVAERLLRELSRTSDGKPTRAVH